MPTIRFDEQEIECESGEILRDALLEGGTSPHNGLADTVNCHGMATCGKRATPPVLPTPRSRERVAAGLPDARRG